MALLSTPYIEACQTADVTHAAVRTTTDLSNGWRFRFGETSEDVTQATFDDGDWQAVSVPHTWNRVGNYSLTASPESDTRRGAGWYRLAFDMPQASQDRRHFLQFDGVATISDVWVNGTYVGNHKGAFARFRFDVTDLLKPGEINLIVVKADNSQPAPGSSTEHVLPLGGDYFVHGGIYRGASLISTASAQIDMLDYGGPGIYITTPSVSPDRAEVEVLTRLRNHGTETRRLSLATAILDAEGKAVATDSVPVELGAAATARMRRTLVLPSPRLWQGSEDPYLYQVAVELLADKGVIDRVVQPLGVRTFAFDPNRGFILNGTPTPLHGVSRHQDRAGKGWALSPEDHAEDMAIMLEMGVNTVRHAHYQHAQEWCDLADTHGLVVWAELPFTHETSLTHDAPTPELIVNAKVQLVELIRQNYNHPSIMIWGIGNEIDVGAMVAARSRPGQEIRAQSLGMLKTLNLLAQQEDPSRPTAYADCCEDTPFALPGREVLSGATDITAYNRYYGWYYGTAEDMGAALDSLHAKYPGLPIAVSEYGAGGVFTQHTDNPEGGPINSVGRPHPEEYQSWYHEKTWPILQARPYLGATWAWNMFDFSTRREEGESFDINDKGLVHHDRQMRKDAFFYYKAQWSDEPVLHITGRRYVDRAYPVVDVQVYSNAPEAGLTVNGASLGDAPCRGRICVWSDVLLAPGPNAVAVEATIEGELLADRVTWNAPDRADGLRIRAGTLTGTTLPDGRRFGSDNFFVGGTARALTPFFLLAMGNEKVVTGTRTPELYEAYREGDFRYELPLPDGEWMVTLHMFEPEEGNAAARTFDVAANGEVVLRDFDPAAAAGGPLQAVSRAFPVTVKGGKLALSFMPKAGDAVVSAIAVRNRAVDNEDQ